LKKNYQPNLSRDNAIGLCIKALLEVVDSGQGNIEVTVLTANSKSYVLSEETITNLVSQIEKEKEAESARKAASSGEGGASSSM